MEKLLVCDRSQRPGGRVTLLLLLIALAARLCMLAYAERNPQQFDYPDSHRYAAVARNIAMGNGPIETPTNRTGTDPFYPYLLSPMPLFGWTQDAAIFTWGRMVNMAMGVLGLLAVIGLARRCGGNAAAIVAGMIYAIDPILLFFNGLPLTEVPFIGLFWSGMYLLQRNREQPDPVRAIAAGLLLGCAAVTRSSGLFLCLVMPAISTIGGPSPRRQRWSFAMLAVLTFLLVLSPVALRNYRLIGRWSPVRTGSGATLLESLGPWADGGPGMEKVVWPHVPVGADEHQRDSVYRDAAIAWAKANAGATLQLAWKKLSRTWSVTLNAPGYQRPAFALICWLSVAPVYVVAIIGAWRLRRRRGELLLLLAPAVYFSLLHCVFVGSVRYRVVVMPGLFILAGVALQAWLCRANAQPVQPAIAPGESAESKA